MLGIPSTQSATSSSYGNANVGNQERAPHPLRTSQPPRLMAEGVPRAELSRAMCVKPKRSNSEAQMPEIDTTYYTCIPTCTPNSTTQCDRPIVRSEFAIVDFAPSGPRAAYPPFIWIGACMTSHERPRAASGDDSGFADGFAPAS